MKIKLITKRSKELSCENKYRHKTEEAANRHKARMEKLKNEAFNVYFCDFCDHYHVGHVSYFISKTKEIEKKFTNSSDGITAINEMMQELKDLGFLIDYCPCKLKEKRCDSNCPCYTQYMSGVCECEKPS